MIVDETADLLSAAGLILWGKFTNAGQTCVAPDHVYVHSSAKERFVFLCRELIAKRYGATDAAVASSKDFGRMIHEQNAKRLGGLLDEAAV